VLGIDLGTSNSCGYISLNGRPTPVVDETGSVIIPSLVYYVPGGKPVIGNSAKSMKGKKNLCMNAKRLIGRKWDSEFIGSIKERCNADLRENHGFPGFFVPVLDRIVSPKEISVEIIKYIIGCAEKMLNNTHVSKLVVTVPAYFNSDQRNGTRDAALEASRLSEESVFLLNEPTSAAICYDLPSMQKKQTIMVYDLGGGTFDVSMIMVEKKEVTVLNTGGDNMLGGDDFTAIVASLICQVYSQTHEGKELVPSNTSDKRYQINYRRLLNIAEETKIRLKQEKEVSVDLTEITKEDNSTVKVTETEMNELLRPKIEKTIEIMAKVLQEANKKKEDIDRVLLVGGSSKLSLVKSMVEAEYGADHVSCTLDPDQCVAMGAMLYFKKFGRQIVDNGRKTSQIGAGTQRSNGSTLHEIVNMNLGTRVGPDHRYDIMIPKGTSVPKTVSKEYAVNNYQTQVKDALFQGEGKYTEECEEIAPIILTGITSAPSGQITLKYTFTVDYGNVVLCTVEELPTHRILFGPRKPIRYTEEGNSPVS